MTDPGQVDVEAFLTEIGVSPDEADPIDSVGNTTILRSEESAASLPTYSPAGGHGAVQVSLGDLIAEGQVTAVYLGAQHSMRRQVAVHTVHHTRRTPAAPGRVLSEGWMQGALEHPNVVPVYGIGRDQEGLPLVLTKVVDTVPWSDVLQNPNHRLAPRGPDPLAFEIRRILDVCRALEHAHHRGIIHRDVKPDNVLIDADGSVYLHGWNLAVSLVTDRSGRFPLASEQDQIAGTPAYMAPELATKDAAALSVRTDVYLVGATLHHVVTGRPRHLGENVFDAFYSSVNSIPIEYGEDVPEELAAILNRAMARNPGDRFGTISELRGALERFLRHRAAHRLNHQGTLAEEEFARAIESGFEDYIVRELFATTFTIYQQAIREWSRNDRAKARLDVIVRRMISYEVARGSVDRARDLLTRLSRPDPALRARVDEAAREEAARDRQKAARVAVENTAHRSERRGRVRFMVAMVTVWTLFGFGFGALEFTGLFQPSLLSLTVVAGLAWMGLAALGGLQADSFFRSLTGRYVLAPTAVILVGSFAIIAYFINQDPAGYSNPAVIHRIVNLHFLLFFTSMATLNAFYDWRLVVSSAAYLGAFIAGFAWPEHVFWLMGGSNFVALSWAGWVIHRRARGKVT
jgi:serine/threonine-protein kinase